MEIKKANPKGNNIVIRTTNTNSGYSGDIELFKKKLAEIPETEIILHAEYIDQSEPHEGNRYKRKIG